MTGGAGFIGSRLCEALLAQGDQVSCFDNLSTGRLDNIRPLLNRRRFEFRQGSILDDETVDSLAATANHVYHLGAAVGVKLILERPVSTITTNVARTEVVLKAAVRHRCKLFIASTSEVYGKDTPRNGRRFREISKLKTLFGYRPTKGLDEILMEVIADFGHIGQPPGQSPLPDQLGL